VSYTDRRVFPTLFHLGHLSLPTFGALAALGLMLALLLSERTARLAGVDPAKLWDAGIFAVIAAFCLSRVLLVVGFWKTFRTSPVLLLAVPSLTATGLLLTVIATGVWLWVKRVPIVRAMDAWAPCGALVWAALALGHFAEGSDAGMPTTLPWAMAPMPGEAVRLHPVALYCAVIALLLQVGSLQLLQRRPRAGITAGVTLTLAGLAQFLVSFLRQPGLKGLGGLDLLQWVAVGMMVVGLVLMMDNGFKTTASAP
jgi:phosphatidylglycerol:prolipoprotein diacylglycerol transferase